MEFVAKLLEVRLEPTRGEPRTERMLAIVLPSTKSETDWYDTLYVMAGCRRLERPFAMSKLMRIDGDKPLSNDYSYSYSIVHQLNDPEVRKLLA